MVSEEEYICYIIDDFPGASFVSSEINEIAKKKRVKIFSLLPPSNYLLKQNRNFASNNIEVYFAPTSNSSFKIIFALLVRVSKFFFKNSRGYLTNFKFILKNNRKLNNFIILLKTIYFVEYTDDIIHIHSHFAMNNSTSALFISNLTDIPFSFTTHAIDIYVDPILIEEKAKKAKFVVTISNYNKKHLKKNFGINQSKIKTIHCGIDLNEFNPRKIKHRGFVILSVARLVEKKGLEYLIKSCYSLKKKNVDFKCIIVGDGPLKNNLVGLIKKYGLGNNIELKGNIPQSRLENIFRKVNLFVLPCIIAKNGDRDGIPVSLMEAMSMEIPVISTDVSGIPELIDEGVNGLLVNEKNVDELTNAIIELYDNVKLREELGKNGREKIKKDFNLEKEIEELYALVCD